MKVDYLVVVEPFGRFKRGDGIFDQSEMDATLAHHGDKIVRVFAAEPATPASGVSPADTAETE